MDDEDAKMDEDDATDAAQVEQGLGVDSTASMGGKTPVSGATGATGSATDDKMDADPPSQASATDPPSSTQKSAPTSLPASLSTSSSQGFGFTENTSTLPIVDASTPLFLSSPPFTIQRLVELALESKRYHSSSTKFLHALERVLRVTATWDVVSEPPV
ncbi:hypothetical protein V8E36_004343 [Tilletia maclaganii]